MKKITFKVSTQKEGSVVSLIKEVNKISCRIYLDIENGYVTVENVNETMIDAVIELVDNYYTILGVDIDNTFEETTAVQVAPVVVESSADTTADAVEETVNETTEVVAEKQPTVLEPQSEDDLIIKKVEFENEYVEGLINKFLRTAAWAMFKMNVPEKEIGDFIYTSINEISMRYNNKDCIEFSVGDVVDCNYGVHLNGEINGGHVPAIVCNISASGMAYLVPITKRDNDNYSHSCLSFNTPAEVVYEGEYWWGGTALLDKAKYVRTERFNAVIGKVTPAFFEKLLYQLASTFDFTGCLAGAVEDDSDLPFTMRETTTATDEVVDEVVETAIETDETTDEVVATATETDETADKVVETTTVTDETTDEVVETPTATDNADTKVTKSKTPAKKVGGEEAALLETIGFAFDKLDASKTVGEQVESFLTDIGMTTTERMVTQSFIIACDIKKINYENVLLGLHEEFPKVKEEIIKNILKEAFKNWLEKYPTLAEKCPKISLMAVLKVFAKKFA